MRTLRLALLAAAVLAFAPLVSSQTTSAAMTATTFDSGPMRTGDSFAFTFNDTGTFSYHCHIHPSMHGNVTVVASGAPSAVTVNITGFAFSPQDVTVAAGGTVTWVNLDHATHEPMADGAGAMMGGGMAMHRPAAAGLAENDTFTHLPPAVAQHGLDRANESKLFAKFSYSNGDASGRFVTFHWSDSTGTMTDFRHVVWNETIFSSIAIDGWQMQSASEAHGAVFHATGMDQFVSVHNDPTASVHVQTDANETNVTFTLAPTEQINTNLTTDRVYVVTDAAGKYHGHLVLLGNATATNTTGPGGTIRVHLGADDGVLFLAHPGGDTAAASGLHAVVAAASAGHLGTVLDVADGGNGTAVEDELPLEAHAATTHIEHGLVNLTVSSDTSDGKTIVLRFANDTFAPGAALNVTVSGQTFAPTNATGQDIKAAVAALQSAGHGATVDFEANGTEIVVQIPHFSDQTVSIQQAGTSGSTTPTGETPSTTQSTTPTKGAPGFEALLVLGAVVAVAFAVRRKA